MCVCVWGGGCDVGGMVCGVWVGVGVSSPLYATKDKVPSAAGVHTLKIPSEK